MPAQTRNDDRTRELAADFLRREEFYQDGARILNAAQTLHRNGGGHLRWCWLADSQYIPNGWGGGNSFDDWNVGESYAATANGGPYGMFNNGNWLQKEHAAWQQVCYYQDDIPFLVWHWCIAEDLNPMGNHTITSKYQKLNDNRAWVLWWDAVAGAFQFVINDNGAAPNDVAVTSSYAETTGVWYFVAGYAIPGTLLRIYVGAADDTALTPDSVVAGVPGVIWEAADAPLAIGCSFGNAGNTENFWDMFIGIGAARTNVPSAEIDMHVTRLFQATKWFYQA